MKLTELHIVGRSRYGYRDVANSLIDRGATPDVIIDTDIPGVTLSIEREHVGHARFRSDFIVVIRDGKRKVGFIDFVEPDAIEVPFHLRKGPHPKFNNKTFTPHSGIRMSHTGRGYVSSVYRWFLDAGHNLVTGDEQTAASNNMWRSLSRHYKIAFLDNNSGNEIHNPTPEEALQHSTRIVLLGKGNHSIEDVFQ